MSSPGGLPGPGGARPVLATEDVVPSMPHQSRGERDAQARLAAALAQSPIPPDELPDNLSLYLSRQQVTDLLAMDALYRLILDVPGVIMEFGVRWGRHLGSFTTLRNLHEPYNVHRRVVGFDTFAGFPDVSEIDQRSRHGVVGGLTVTDGYLDHLEKVLAAHESAGPLGHVRRTWCVTGDVRQSVPQYLQENPQTVIALAYFDLDLYEPTRDVLAAIRPYLCAGSVLAFDQVGHAKWPGETQALREVLGTRTRRLHLIPGFPTPAFLRWDNTS
jgi:hypothetical protein